MNIVVGGVRGSFPVSGAAFVRHGGDTFSVLVEGADGEQLVVDAGSGVMRLLPELRAGCTLAFTHVHLDHLIGLPLLERKWPSRFVSPLGTLTAALEKVFAPPVWPVELRSVNLAGGAEAVDVGGLRLRWHEVWHPDGCVAYRVDEASTGASVVVATDIEWRQMAAAEQESFVRFARGADQMLFDAHFLPEENEAHRGWGHSTWEDAAEAAERAGVKKLRLVHHAPTRTDEAVDAILDAVRRQVGTRFDVQ